MAKRLKQVVWMGGLSALAACGGTEADPSEAPAPTPRAESELAPEAPTVALPEAATPEARIQQGLERLDQLEVLDTADVFATRTEHQWVPYGGLWSSHEVAMAPEEVADRLEVLVVRAEAAVARAEGTGVDLTFGSDARCYALGEGASGAHCLTIDPYEADLAALNALEIVEVEGILFDADAQQGMCYSSWITVTAEDCARAHRLRAIVEATADLPSARLPAEAPDGEPRR